MHNNLDGLLSRGTESTYQFIKLLLRMNTFSSFLFNASLHIVVMVQNMKYYIGVLAYPFYSFRIMLNVITTCT